MKNITLTILLLLMSSSVAVAKLTGALNDKATAARIIPVGEVAIAVDATAAGQTATNTANKKSAVSRPIAIYKANCAMCHAVNLAGAPKPGDKTAWDKRLKQGKDTLLQHVIYGYKAMPPKGGCMKCSKEDLLSTIEQMISGAGLD
ncbi:MAG: cytochrome c5 family protein [Legionellales bacterium]|nr:MAG: cytochrome c5 family protein [Legionellales bacterium]